MAFKCVKGKFIKLYFERYVTYFINFITCLSMDLLIKLCVNKRKVNKRNIKEQDVLHWRK